MLRRAVSARGGVHDDGDAGQAHQGADYVVAVGPVAVDDHAPGQRSGDEDAAVGSEDPPEVGVVLQGGDEAVDSECDDAGTDPGPSLVLAHALPDQPGATDLEQGGGEEQGHGARDGHERRPYRRAPVLICTGSSVLPQSHPPWPQAVLPQPRSVRRRPSHQVAPARTAKAAAMAGSRPTTAPAPVPTTPAAIRAGSRQHAAHARPASAPKALGARWVLSCGSAAGSGMAHLLGEAR